MLPCFFLNTDHSLFCHLLFTEISFPMYRNCCICCCICANDAVELEEVCIRKYDGSIMLYVQSGAVTIKYFKLFNINVIYM